MWGKLQLREVFFFIRIHTARAPGQMWRLPGSSWLMLRLFLFIALRAERLDQTDNKNNCRFASSVLLATSCFLCSIATMVPAEVACIKCTLISFSVWSFLLRIWTEKSKMKTWMVCNWQAFRLCLFSPRVRVWLSSHYARRAGIFFIKFFLALARFFPKWVGSIDRKE